MEMIKERDEIMEMLRVENQKVLEAKAKYEEEKSKKDKLETIKLAFKNQVDGSLSEMRQTLTKCRQEITDHIDEFMTMDQSNLHQL